MSALRSSPGGLALVGWRWLVGAVLALWLAPAAIGAAALGLLRLGGSADDPAGLRSESLALLALLSPLASWAGFALIGLFAAFLLRRGAYGWLSAALSGAFAGLSLALHTGGPTPVVIGIFMALLLRQILALRAPEAF